MTKTKFMIFRDGLQVGTVEAENPNAAKEAWAATHGPGNYTVGIAYADKVNAYCDRLARSYGKDQY